MPCSCDGFEDTTLKQIADDRERLTKELCRARAIVRKLYARARALDPETEKQAENEIRLLIEHKRAEVQRDIGFQQDRLFKWRQNVAKIRELGGEPNERTLAVIREIEADVERLSNLTDEQLLA